MKHKHSDEKEISKMVLAGFDLSRGRKGRGEKERIKEIRGGN